MLVKITEIGQLTNKKITCGFFKWAFLGGFLMPTLAWVQVFLMKAPPAMLETYPFTFHYINMLKRNNV